MINWINKKRNQKGFTLIELVVVIAILGILMAIAVPRLSGFTNQAKVKADEASKETIIKAAELYIAANNAVYGGNVKIDNLITNQLINGDEIYSQVDTTKKFDLSYGANGFTVELINK